MVDDGETVVAGGQSASIFELVEGSFDEVGGRGWLQVVSNWPAAPLRWRLRTWSAVYR